MKQTDYETFVRFKFAYPKRGGANPWRPAEKKFNALVKSGFDPEKIIAGARQFAVEEGIRGKVGTQFIPMAVTWLNQKRFEDYAKAEDAEPNLEKFWDDVLTSYKKFGIWSRWAGPEPQSPACKCPRELLEKHGLTA